MKTYMLMIILLVGFTTSIRAQNKIPTVQELTDKSMELLNERLKLSPTQKSVIYNYTSDMYKQQLELLKKQQAGASKEEDIFKFNKFQNETNDNIRSILKDDQVLEFDKIIQERLDGGGKKKKNRKRKNKQEEESVTGVSGLKLQN